MCTYHGWTYDLKGNLVGVPGFKEVYHEELDRENWGLIKAAQVETYKGFIFATMDPEAPALHEYLGDVGRIGIDMLADAGRHGRIVGGVQKYTIPCNWKFAADNVGLLPRPHHPRLGRHGRLARAELRRATTSRGAQHRRQRSRQRRRTSILSRVRPRARRRASCPRTGEELIDGRPDSSSWRLDPETQRKAGPGRHARLGCIPEHLPQPLRADAAPASVGMRMPKGPTHDRDLVVHLRRQERADGDCSSAQRFTLRPPLRPRRHAASRTTARTGTRAPAACAASSAAATRCNYSMGLGHGEVIEDEGGPPHIDGLRQRARPALALPRLGGVDGRRELGRLAEQPLAAGRDRLGDATSRAVGQEDSAFSLRPCKAERGRQRR